MSRHHTNTLIETGEKQFGTCYNRGYWMNVNGYRISVQWGVGNYVDSEVRYGRQLNVNANKIEAAMDFNHWQSNTAEVMIDHVINGTIKNTSTDLGDAVFGFCSATCVAKFIGCIASAQPGDDITKAINQIFQSN
jgi:hypothetical protein